LVLIENSIAILIQNGFSSFTWIATIPPVFVVLVAKVVIDRKFNSVFREYIPSPEEIRTAKIHSQKADAKGNKLERRFGHPALHMEVFTPMLHANMMPLLQEVYHGRLNNTTGFGNAKVNVEGTKMEAQVLPGGIRIAGVQQVGHYHYIVSIPFFIGDY
jgi:calcium permeable stress-gated cation channel